MFRIKPNFRPCKDKGEFIRLFTRDMENLGLMEKSTGSICFVYKICDDFVKIIKRKNEVDVTYSVLFEDYIFYNRAEPIIGIENK